MRNRHVKFGRKIPNQFWKNCYKTRGGIFLTHTVVQLGYNLKRHFVFALFGNVASGRAAKELLHLFHLFINCSISYGPRHCMYEMLDIDMRGHAFYVEEARAHRKLFATSTRGAVAFKTPIFRGARSRRHLDSCPPAELKVRRANRRRPAPRLAAFNLGQENRNQSTSSTLDDDLARCNE